MLNVLLLIIGFVFIIKGADFLIDGSAFIAKRIQVSELFIGLTIVAFGTSLPELVVNVSASLKDSSQLAIGNVFGSNIANVWLVLGATATLYSIPLKKQTAAIDLPLTVLIVLLFGYLANGSLWGFSDAMLLGYLEAIVLLLIFVLYMYYIAKTSKHLDRIVNTKNAENISLPKSVLLIILGIVGLYAGGHWIVISALRLADLIGVSESFIGLSIIAFGTSAPELATCLKAGYKGNFDLAIGNIIGSNIFNLLWVLPVSSIIRPIEYKAVYNTDLTIVFLSVMTLNAAVLINKNRTISKISGLMFLLMYLLYLGYLFYRG